jgi:hypothetical protein
MGGAVAGGLACSSAPRKVPGTAGLGGSTGSSTGTGGSTPTGSGGSSATGAGGDSSGTGGSSATGAGGDSSGTGGSTTGIGGSTGTGGAGVAGGAGGAAGDANGAAGSAAGAGGGAGTAPADNGLRITDAFPIAVTKYWYPSGWDGDAVTFAAFNNVPPPIKIEMMTGATSGPCSKRVANAIGDCFKVTYTPVSQDGGAPGHASVGLIPVIPGGGMPNYNDPTMAPHVPAGATTITAEVAGDKGGEQVQFNLWDSNQGELFMPTLTADQAWQKIPVTIPQPYDQELSPFGWYSASTTPIVFYYDDVRINNN